VLGFDAPAHGRSSGKLINVLIYKAFVDELQQRYGPIKSFIAHSFGGLAISLALESWPYNEEYKAVLIAPATETSTAVDYLFSILKLPASLRTEFENVILEKGNEPVSWYSISRAAQNIRSQVLWLHDKDDDMTPLRDVEPVMEKGYPNFKFHITAGLGHRRIYRDNTVEAEIVAFL
jgi:pimeloyl-ACP methyl ester carboxylesterase